LEDSDADLERSSSAPTIGIAEPATMKRFAESSTRLADLQHGNGRWSLRSAGNLGWLSSKDGHLLDLRNEGFRSIE
jgi:hypothetical protein